MMRPEQGCEPGGEVTLIEYWNVCVRRWRLLVGCVLIVTLTAVAHAYLKPNTYLSTARLLPINGTGTVPAGMGGMASMFGLTQGNSEKNQLLALLTSKTLAEEIVNNLDLITEFFGPTANESLERKHLRVSAVGQLLGMVTASDDVSAGALCIEVESRDAELSQRIALAYVEGVRSLVNENSLTLAKRRRLFIHEQMLLNRRKLLMAEKTLNTFYERKQVSARESTTDVLLGEEGFSQLQAAAVATEESMTFSQVSETTDSVDYKSSPAVPLAAQKVRNVPHKSYLQYLTLQRNILAEVQSMLSRQYEMTKIEEAESRLSFHVLDMPELPLGRHTPNRYLIIVLGIVTGICSGIFLMFFVEYVDRLRRQHMRSGQQL